MIFHVCNFSIVALSIMHTLYGEATTGGSIARPSCDYKVFSGGIHDNKRG